jgi:autotransporter-associated beta strand protein
MASLCGALAFRAGLALIAGSTVMGVSINPVRAQQYFNGSQTSPNASINGGGGAWDNATTNWTNATGTVSNAYDPSAGTTTVFGASGSSTPATGGNVNVTGGGIQLTGTVQFRATGDQSIYTIQGGAVVTAAGGTTFDVGNVAPGSAPSAVISSTIFGNGLTKTGAGTLVLSSANAYVGDTLISGGTLQVTNALSVGSSNVRLNGGTFQADGAGNLAIFNSFNINTTGGTIDNNGVVLTIASVIANGNGGTGVLQLTDSSGGFGTTVLGDLNTYTGGTKVVGTTVQVANNFSVGTGTVTLENGTFQADGVSNLAFANNFKINSTPSGSFIDANGVRLTIGGNITGAGQLTVQDGVVVLTGNNTYSGGTTICGCATLQLGDATHTASIVGAVINEQGFFSIVNANTAAITSINNDGGLVVFFGANTASTAAIVNRNGGETDFGAASGTDTATAGNATIVNRSGGSTVFFAMTTAGGATITNWFSGTTAFLENSSAGNSTIVNRFGGLTLFEGPSTAGSANITNRFGGSTLFIGNSSAGNATITNNSSGGIISLPVGLGFFDASTAGTATIVNNNNGFIAFGLPFGFDTSSADHASITNNAGGRLEFNAFTTAGNATITTNSGGAVAFFDNSTGGNAQFITNGTGYVDFGEGFGPNGDGRMTAGSIAGSGFYYVGGGNTLIVGSNNLSTAVSGVIADNNPCGCTTGSGSLEKVGAGMLTLSGTNTYTGTTTVNGGFLDVEGSIASSSLTTANAGGALTGAGRVGNTTIATGGIFLPGNGQGTSTTVAGNLAFQSGALYLVTLNSTTSTSAKVSGTATLAGTVGAAFVPGGTVMKQYTILTAAGGVSGAFSGVGLSGVPSALTGTLSYDPTHAFLNFALDYNAVPGLNVNQRNVGSALTNFFNANGGIPTVFATLSPSGLTQASGELATGSQQATFDAMNLFMGLLTDPFVAGRNGGAGASGSAQPYAEEAEGSLAYAARRNPVRDAFAKIPTKADAARNDLLDSRWSVWGAAYGGGGNIDGNAALGSNSANVRAFGLVGGADYLLSPTLLAGFALAGGSTNFSVTNFGSGRSDLFQAGAFVRKTFGAAYVSAAAAYGWQDVTTDRTVTIAGFDQLHAEFKANAYSGRVEGGYRFVTPWMGVTPYTAGQFTTYSLPAYAEQVLAGTGTFALNYAAKSVTDPRTELGVRTDRSFALANGILTLRGRLAWAHDYTTDRNVSAVFQTLPGAAFVVNGAAQAQDSALTTASAEMKWLNGWSAAATFEGEFSGISRFYAGKGVVRYTW